MTYIIIGIVAIIVIFFILPTIFKKNSQGKYGEQEVVIEVRNELFTIVEEFKKIYLQEVIKQAQTKPNPNKEEVMLEMGRNGELDEIIKYKIMGFYNEIGELSKTIFLASVFRKTLDEKEVEEYSRNSNEIITESIFEIMKEFRRQNIMQFNDKQMDNYVISQIDSTEKKL